MIAIVARVPFRRLRLPHAIAFIVEVPHLDHHRLLLLLLLLHLLLQMQ
jgi:hypothetical protein